MQNVNEEVLDLARLRRMKTYRPRWRPSREIVTGILAAHATRRIKERREKIKLARAWRKANASA